MTVKKNVKEMNTDIYHKSLSVECFTIPDWQSQRDQEKIKEAVHILWSSPREILNIMHIKYIFFLSHKLQ